VREGAQQLAQEQGEERLQEEVGGLLLPRVPRQGGNSVQGGESEGARHWRRGGGCATSTE
jgi:hypothetical protein